MLRSAYQIFLLELHLLDLGEVCQVVVEILLVEIGGVQLHMSIPEILEVLFYSFLGVGHILNIMLSTALSSSNAMMVVCRDCLHDSTVSRGSMIFSFYLLILSLS